jgi:hypothetical protein
MNSHEEDKRRGQEFWDRAMNPATVLTHDEAREFLGRVGWFLNPYTNEFEWTRNYDPHRMQKDLKKRVAHAMRAAT